MRVPVAIGAGLRWSRVSLVCLSSSLAAACGAGMDADAAPIMDRLAWAPVTGEDPFEDRRAGRTACDAAGFALRADPRQATDKNPDGILPTIDTDACDFVTLTQPSLRDIAAGETIGGQIFHLRLWADAPAEAFLSLRIGDDAVVEQTLAIDLPAPDEDCPPDTLDGFCHRGGGVVGSWTAETDIPAGTPLYFHADNHGSNEYWLIELSSAY